MNKRLSNETSGRRRLSSYDNFYMVRTDDIDPSNYTITTATGDNGLSAGGDNNDTNIIIIIVSVFCLLTIIIIGSIMFFCRKKL